MSAQPDEPAAGPLADVESRAARVRELRAEVAAAVVDRNRAIVAAVDEGWPQDRLAAAAGFRSPSAVTRILADPKNYDGDGE